MVTPYIVQVNAFNLDRWWPVLEPALEDMDHIFNTTPGGRPLLEIQEKIVEGLITGWMGLEHHEGEETPRLVGGMLTTVSRDPVTSGKHLLIYGLWAFQRMSKEMLEKGRMTIVQHAQEQNCPQVLAYVTDERVLRYAQQMGFFDRTATFLIADVEGMPWAEGAVDLEKLIGPAT